MSSNDTDRIDCLKCKYFFVTWNPKFPRGCKLYGFKTAQFPSAEVFKASGEDCMGFEKKDLEKQGKAE
jgi:hypothetical protein